MFLFVFGLFLGAMFGISVMALLAINREADRSMACDKHEKENQ